MNAGTLNDIVMAGDAPALRRAMGLPAEGEPGALRTWWTRAVRRFAWRKVSENEVMSALTRASGNGFVEGVRLLAPMVPPILLLHPMVEAAKTGQAAVTDLLLPDFLASGHSVDHALTAAARAGQTAVVRQLLPHSPSEDAAQRVVYEAVTGTASQARRKEAVADLLRTVSAAEDHTAALIHAASLGDPQLVKLLIPSAQVRTHGSLALQRAALGKSEEVFEVLLPHSDANEAWDGLLANEAKDLGNQRPRARMIQHIRRGYSQMVGSSSPVADEKRQEEKAQQLRAALDRLSPHVSAERVSAHFPSGAPANCPRVETVLLGQTLATTLPHAAAHGSVAPSRMRM